MFTKESNPFYEATKVSIESDDEKKQEAKKDDEAEKDQKVETDQDSPDVNKDGKVDAKDDINKDGKVDKKDLKIQELEKDIKIKEMEKKLRDLDDPAPEEKMKEAKRLRVMDTGEAFDCVNEAGDCVKSFPYDNKETYAKKARYEAQRYCEKYYSDQIGESTKEYAKSLEKIANKAKRDNISKSDLDTLSKLAQLMARANEEVEDDKEESLEEKRMFIYAARMAREEGKKTFMFAGKEFPVTLKKETVKEEIQEASCGCGPDCEHCGGTHPASEIGNKCSCCDNVIKEAVKEEEGESEKRSDKINDKMAVDESVDKKVLKTLQGLEDDEARMIIQGMPKRLQKHYMKALGMKETVDGRTRAYKETAARLMSKKSMSERELSKAELKKREEIAQAIERDNPDMPMGQKMAIATAQAKKVSEAGPRHTMTPMKDRFGGSVIPKEWDKYKKFMKQNNLDEPTVRMMMSNPDDAETKRMMKNSKYKQALQLYKNAHRQNEEVEISEASIQVVAKGLEDYAKKFGGVDKKDFMHAAKLMKSNQKKALVDFVDDMDTEPREKIIMMVKNELGQKTAEKMFNISFRTNKLPKTSTQKSLASISEGENPQVKGGDPCWAGYEMVGTKMKNGKEVPNCVPVSEARRLKHDELVDIGEILGFARKSQKRATKKVSHDIPDDLLKKMQDLRKKHPHMNQTRLRFLAKGLITADTDISEEYLDTLIEAGYMDVPQTQAEVDKKYPDTKTDVMNKNSRDLQSVGISEAYANYISFTTRK